MPGRALNRRLVSVAAIGALGFGATACMPTAGADPSGDSGASGTATASARASTSPSSVASPTATPSNQDPAFVPALAAIQMIGPRLGWAVGSHAIYATIDGAHWATQFASTEEFVGVDFISSTTGWVVGVRSLLGTTDGGRTWHGLGQPSSPIRSVHFVSAQQGFGIAGGTDPEPMHGRLVPQRGATLVTSSDGGVSWTALDGPPNPQTVCFSEPAQGWIGTGEGVYIYRQTEQGHSWSKVLQRPDHPADGEGTTLIECAAPHALWVVFSGGDAAAGHSPYVVYATVDGQSWRAVMAEAGTIGNSMPGVPAGPGSYPGSFSVVDASEAVFVGDTPPAAAASCVIATGGGATLKRTGAIANAPETFAAAFTTTTTGWVLTRNAGGDYVIDATVDGGYHWSQQLAVPPSSAG
jgi:hypothetical protein